MTDLFTDLPDPDEPLDGFTLWFRPFKNGDGRPRRWTRVGSARTRQELVNAQAGSGEFLILPAGEEPGAGRQM